MPEPLTGRQVGHYRILEQIGQGGMGVVYLAEDTRLGRRVALKVLPAEMSGDPARRARFEREARAVASLNHPNIVTLHAVEEMEGVTFLTMELVQGRRLGEMLPREGLPLARLLEWSLGIADALVAAHRAGVVHRDLKPDNIMITNDGRLKVLDFGLAKLRESALETAGTALPTGSITEEGKILGTVSYMSPEQAEGKPLDHRSDIFSFGVLMYEMATGRRPFQGETAISTISSILKDTPRPADEINTSLPRHLGRIVRRCLAKEPERRFQSTDDLRNELAELKEESDSGVLTRARPAAAAAQARGGSRFLLPVMGVALAAALVAGWLWLGQRRGPHSTGPAGPESFRMSRVTTDGKVFLAAISPEGRYVAYVRRDGAMQSLRLRQLATGDEVQVVPPMEVTIGRPSFSGDGNYLLYIPVEPGRVTGWIHRVSVLGGAPRRILEGAVGVEGSPDGSRLAWLGGAMEDSSLRISGAEGESPRDVAARKGRDHFDSDPAWSSDGKSLAIVSHRFGEPQQIVLVDPASGTERVVPTPTLRSIEFVTWMPGRDALIVSGSERPVTQLGTAQIWEVSTQGNVAQLTRDLNDYTSVSITGDGSTVAAVQVERRGGIDVAEVRDGVPGPFREMIPVSAGRAGAGGVAWLSEDRLVYGGAHGEEYQIYAADVSSRTSRPLTSGAQHRSPAASRDGRTLVVVRDDQERAGLWRIDGETGRGEKLTPGRFEGQPAVSPDGAWVVYAAWGDDPQLMKIPAKGGEAVTLFRGTIWCTSVMGEEVLCLKPEASGATTPVLVPLAGGEPRPVSGFPEGVTFGIPSPDGRSITYLMSREGGQELWTTPLHGGAARRLARFEGNEVREFAWSPGGTRLAVVKSSPSGDVVLLRRTP